MRTMRLEEIVRQKDPELKQAVEQLARGQVGAAIDSLDKQGRVHEVKRHEERITAIAREYAKSPESTLVVSPDNLSRTEINQRIHAELQSRGSVGKEEHQVQTLVPRQEMTGADRSWAQQYQVDDILRYSRSSRETGIAKGEYTRVKSIDAQNNRLTVLRADGSETTYDPRRQMGVSVYREQEKAFSVGDRIQFTAPNHELKIANRELGTVESIAPDGAMRLKLDSGRSMDYEPQRHPHLDHGYAVTSIPARDRPPNAYSFTWIRSLRRKTCSIAAWRMSLFRVDSGTRRFSQTTARSCRRLLVTMSRTRAHISQNRRLRQCSIRRLPGHNSQRRIWGWVWA